MKVEVLSVGTKMPSWVEDVCKDYLKRFDRHIHIQLRSVPLHTKHKDTERLLAQIPPEAYCILLDEKGKLYSSTELSKQWEVWQNLGRPLCFVIGGPDGFDPAIFSRANELWSLSPLTFPHPLVRVMVVEQLYRALSIHKGHPYHRA